jgi:nucleotide-binding universal stress UspA family protein
MKTILVPTDFSPAAKIAMDVAAEIALKENAQLILLHIVELPADDSFNVEGQMATSDDLEERIFTMKLIEKAKFTLSRMVAQINLKGVATLSELRLGNPFHGIRSMITDHKVDLVVMGTAGHSKLEEMIIGSNTEKVVRHAKCPVLTLHQKPAQTEFKKIVYATGMSQDEESFARVVMNTRDMYDGTINLVRVNTPLNFESDVKVKREMELFARKMKLTHYTLNVFNDYSEEDGIINFANIIDADLIAMATHGRTGFAHVLAGSIAEDVANHATKPVLTYVSKKKVA